MQSKLWDKNNPLFFYGNEEKLNDLLGRIYHSVITGFQTQNKKNFGINAKLSAKLSEILLSYGLPKLNIDMGANFGVEKIKTEISSITFDTKLNMLYSYCEKKKNFSIMIYIMDSY